MVFDKLFEKKVKEVQEDTISFKESHPVIFYGGICTLVVMGGTILAQKIELDCYRAINGCLGGRGNVTVVR